MSKESIVGQLVRVDFVTPLAEWQGQYNFLEVWRSTLTPSGPFEELTGPRWSGPRLPRDGGDRPSSPVTGHSLALTGKTLEFVVNEQFKISTMFTGPDPVTAAQAAAQVSASGTLSAYVDAESNFVVELNLFGCQAILRVVSSDAASILGLPTTEPLSVAYGHDARGTLVAPIEQAIFLDPHGHPEAVYKTRYRNSETGVVSEFSAPTYTNHLITPVAGRSVGYVDIVDAEGRPVVNQEIRISMGFDGKTTDTDVGTAAVVGADLAKLTDRNGHAEFHLLRGSKIAVIISGTPLVRNVTVPVDESVTRFNLLDPTVGSDDLFNVQVPAIDYAVRRHL